MLDKDNGWFMFIIHVFIYQNSKVHMYRYLQEIAEIKGICLLY